MTNAHRSQQALASPMSRITTDCDVLTLKNQRKTVLITGAKSQLAQELLTTWRYFLRLQQQDEAHLSRVHSPSVNSTPIDLATGGEPHWQLIMLDRAALDITQDAQIAIAFAQYRPDWVINCAAYNQVDRAEQEQDAAYRVNAHGPELLAKHCAEIGARLLHISSDYVFSGKAFNAEVLSRKAFGDEESRGNNNPCASRYFATNYSADIHLNCTANLNNKPLWGYQELDVAAPQSVYGMSKLLGEQAVFRHLGTNATVIRTAWLYAHAGHNFVNTMQRLMQTSTKIEVVDNELGSPTWAYALAKVIWLVIGAGLSGTYHYAAQGHCTWHEFACEIQHQALTLGRLSKPCDIVPTTAQAYALNALASGRILAPRPRYSVLSSTQLHTHLMQYYASQPFAQRSFEVDRLWQDWRQQLALMFQQGLLSDTN